LLGLCQLSLYIYARTHLLVVEQVTDDLHPVGGVIIPASNALTVAFGAHQRGAVLHAAKLPKGARVAVEHGTWVGAAASNAREASS
jgi:hypothetical protein